MPKKLTTIAAAYLVVAIVLAVSDTQLNYDKLLYGEELYPTEVYL